MLKCVFDLVFGTLVLILTLPLMVLLAFLVYLEDGPPVILRQPRVGKDGELFQMFKIRTMIKSADLVQIRSMGEVRTYKTKNDPRVTRVGRWLRRFSLDELPQLFNVLQGTMSLVGPRPELPHLAEKYEPWQRERFSVLPGITGWWQIHHREHQPLQLHIDDDIFYIRNYSIGLDIEILVRTIWAVLGGRGAY